LADVQADADRTAFFTRLDAAMRNLNQQDFTAEVQRRITALQAEGHAEWAAAVHAAATRYSWWTQALDEHPAAWPLLVEAMAQQKLEGGCDASVSDATLRAANGFLNALLDLLDVLTGADALLEAA